MASENIVDRFLRYVRIDTQSDEDSTSSPSSAKQLDLAKVLVEELRALGLSDVALSEHGVVTATLPANLPADQAAKVPVVGLLAHLDTSPAVSGANVKPQIIVYGGGDIALPGEASTVIRAAECPELAKYKGQKIITSDGTTLLGADDKAGVAAVMHALSVFQAEPSIKHGKLRIGFTPDEEVGRGTEHLDPKAFGADLAYTIDGGDAGEVENETFCADAATVVIQGHNQHPGYAKNIMINAVRIAADFIARLPRHRAPETTEKRECYLHPDSITGSVEQTTIKMIVRAFTLEELQALERTLEEIRQEVLLLHPKAKIEIKITEQYRNMRYQLEQKPSVVEHAMEAVRRVGLTPRLASIRGGTDGARLTEQGLPTPNLFAGGVNFHSKKEWIAVEALEAASRTVVELVKLWVE
ncbi:MAG: peptidase T, partial [Deltaproteobacteria bacterium]|nr:peptidase T [Deltaproteobacteria bacterium]